MSGLDPSATIGFEAQLPRFQPFAVCRRGQSPCRASLCGVVHLRRSTAEQLRLDQRVFDQSDFRVNDLDQWRAQHGARESRIDANSLPG